MMLLAEKTPLENAVSKREQQARSHFRMFPVLTNCYGQTVIGVTRTTTARSYVLRRLLDAKSVSSPFTYNISILLHITDTR
jgi:hypothetical protein